MSANVKGRMLKRNTNTKVGTRKQRFAFISKFVITITAGLLFSILHVPSLSILFQHVSEFENSMKSCRNYLLPMAVSGVGNSTTLPEVVSHLLHKVDHIFVLSYTYCKTVIPPELRQSTTCVIGKALDDCAPKEFIRGPHIHAMKVTFSHAVILKQALELGLSNIAVLEDDVAFIPRSYSADLDQQFSRLLLSNSWSIIRLGFRAYFLESSAIPPCPRVCRCSFDASIGDHFCELRKSGCDLRSSDLYILNSRHFSQLQRLLLDLRQANPKRIIDVYPMRAFANQWVMLPQVSFQRQLDIPLDYQLGLSALYTSKCAGPRPLGKNTSGQLFDIFI
jgi:hypothetical protein